MNIKKRVWIGPLVCLLVLSAILTGWAGSTFPAMASVSPGSVSDGKVVMDVACGYEGNVKGGRYIPVVVSLENPLEQEFVGTIQIQTMESDYDVYRHDYPVTVAAGESTSEQMYLPIGNRADQMYVTLVNEAGSQIARKRVKLNFSTDV